MNIREQKFNRLSLIRFDHKRKNISFWLFRCDCGIEKVIERASVIRGRTKSCGCLKKEFSLKRFYIHGMKGTRFYNIWQGMKARCNNVNFKQYNDYGGRGITVCNKWLKFINFRNDMYESYLEHEKQYGTKQTTIDRIDNDSGYKRSNCWWATRREQYYNSRIFK